MLRQHETIHTGNFHRKGYLILHHLAGATVQAANLVNYNGIPQDDRSLLTYITIMSSMVIYVSKLLSARVRFGSVPLASCGMDQVLTSQQQCLLLVFLKLPVDQVIQLSPKVHH